MDNVFVMPEYAYVSFEDAMARRIPCDEEPPRRVCPYCGEDIVFHGTVRDGRIRKFFPSACSCPEAKAAAEIESQRENEAIISANRERRRRERAENHRDGVGRNYREKTFNDYVTDSIGLITAKRSATRFVDDFDADRLRDGKYFLVLYGGCGCGKTHLAAAIANELKRRYHLCRFTTFGDLLSSVRDTYSTGDSEQVVIDGYRKAPLLIIDDLGKEKATEFSTATLFNIVNYRYESGLPLVITTNHSLDELPRRLTPPGGDEIEAEAIVSRLCEVARRVDMSGIEDWRMK